jgi:WD40 repeat protein
MFNENFNCFVNSTNKYVCIGTNTGFIVYGIHPLKKIISRDIEGGVSIIKMLYESNIFLFCGRSETGTYPNNKLFIWDDNKKIVLGDILYNHQIQNIDVTQSYIFVQVNNKVYIYQFDNLNLLKHYECGNATFSISHINNILAYPTPNMGEINIVNINNNNDIPKLIKAHESNIEMITLTSNGQYLATASEKGTIIRLYDTSSCEMVNEFRRGTEYVNILQLLFHPNMSMLLVESDKSTIHIFNTELEANNNLIYQQNDNSNNEIWKVPDNKKYENYGMNYVKYILPKYFHSKWSFMSYTIPDIHTLNIFDEKTCNIYSFGKDGQYYECCFNDPNKPIITKVIKFIIDKEDPFKDRKIN